VGVISGEEVRAGVGEGPDEGMGSGDALVGYCGEGEMMRMVITAAPGQGPLDMRQSSPARDGRRSR
jgi:hypothetical protein